MKIGCSPIANHICFKGYDATPLKALYMQNIPDNYHMKILDEMSNICKSEKIDLYFSQFNMYLNYDSKNPIPGNDLKFGYLLGPRWAQDHKAFIKYNNHDELLWNTTRSSGPNLEEMRFFSDYVIKSGINFPQGGNYFIGKKNDGKKWLLIGKDNCIFSKRKYIQNDQNTLKRLSEIFNVDIENIMPLSQPDFHLDMAIRPIGFPYILVNDPELSLKNIESIENDFPDFKEEIESVKYRTKCLAERSQYADVDKTVEELKAYGFVPIRIAGCYGDKINFMNAIVNKKENGELTYITNSAKNSTSFGEKLEEMFMDDLETLSKQSGIKLGKVYTISGGKSEIVGENLIMYNIAHLHGGIHCMASEVPNFN